MDVPSSRNAGWGRQDPRLSRLDRLGQVCGWSSPRPVGGFAAASIAGFDPVGQVFGTIVASPGSLAFDRCYVTGSAARGGRTSADRDNPILAWLYETRRLAMERAVAECRALGGDGIIGMRLSCTDFLPDTIEVTVEGTAVRARSPIRPAVPFTTDVSGPDLARLLRSGWMPSALVLGIAIASCHFDGSMYQQTRRGIGAAGNREVAGYTRVVNDARREARRALESAVREQGGQGAVVREMTQRFFERECPSVTQHSDYVVEATILGSAIVPFERSEPAAPQAPLAIMRLDRGPGPASHPAPAPGAAAGPSLGDRTVAYWTARRDAQAAGSSDAP